MCKPRTLLARLGIACKCYVVRWRCVLLSRVLDGFAASPVDNLVLNARACELVRTGIFRLIRRRRHDNSRVCLGLARDASPNRVGLPSQVYATMRGGGGGGGNAAIAFV